MSETKLEKENMSIEDALEEFGSIIWNGKGVSMRPLIRDSVDYVVIEKADREIRPYDVVLYARDTYATGDTARKQNYVLHRFIKRDGDKCVILGDNCITYEYVPADKIVGVMTGLVRNGKPHDFDSASYKTYMNLWIKPRRMRVAVIKARAKARRVCSKIVKGALKVGRKSAEN